MSHSGRPNYNLRYQHYRPRHQQPAQNALPYPHHFQQQQPTYFRAGQPGYFNPPYNYPPVNFRPHHWMQNQTVDNFYNSGFTYDSGFSQYSSYPVEYSFPPYREQNYELLNSQNVPYMLDNTHLQFSNFTNAQSRGQGALYRGQKGYGRGYSRGDLNHSRSAGHPGIYSSCYGYDHNTGQRPGGHQQYRGGHNSSGTRGRNDQSNPYNGPADVREGQNWTSSSATDKRESRQALNTKDFHAESKPATPASQRPTDAMNDYVGANVGELETTAEPNHGPSLNQRASLTKQLTSGSYECVICCASIRADVAVWSCDSCYHVFHLYCVKKWARSSLEGASEGDDSGWRCPTCQNITLDVPNTYLCFCGKVSNPDWNRIDIPHSCGEVCGKPRPNDCPHRCNILCHPGPCPDCGAVTARACNCGKRKKSMRCGSAAGYSCEEVCGRSLNCGEHRCVRVCHAGDCFVCRAVVAQECHGKHESREVACGSRESSRASYSCGQPCVATLPCGNHKCDEPCHDGDCGPCPRLPSVAVTCPCGKVRVNDLSTPERTSCLDPLATCDNLCSKQLPCGPKDKRHVCESVCHDGPCPPCEKSMPVACVCSALTDNMQCTKALQYTEEEPYKCKKKCKKKKSCGRHRCNQVCCVDKEHLCTQICGRRLTCGRHRCDRLCHATDCSPCGQSSYDELRCECGAAVIYPPVACGTLPPECDKPCTRQHPCTHDVLHNCHHDDKCPPCVILTSKTCMGGHEVRNNIPCHQTDVYCGLPCDKPLSCLVHKCKRLCHKDKCLDDAPCTQPCPVPRPVCGHACNAPCHGTTPCPSSPCAAKVTLKCRCGNRVATAKCTDSSSGDGNAAQKYLTNQVNLQNLQYGQDIDLRELESVTKGPNRLLECDSACALLERNKRLALALQIRNPDFSAKVGTPSYPPFLKDYAKDNQQFVASVEKQISELVQKAQKSKQTSRSHSFPPMNMNQRRVIHELAPFYGCETLSYDSEPKKNVVVTAFSKKSWLPSVTLTMAIQRGERPPPPVPIPHVHRESELREISREARQSTDVLVESKRVSIQPNIDYFDMTPL